jgi:hypothetical protein
MLALADLADLDNGPRTHKSGTERMCAVTRSVRPIDELIRFVIAPTGEVVADLKRKLPGRGMWVSASPAAVAEAVKRNLFAKSFKKNVKASPALADDTDKLMVRGIIDALAITAKAGQVVSGFGKVEDALRQGHARGLIHASNGAPDGIRKLDAIARQNALSGPEYQNSHESSDSEAASTRPENPGLLPIVAILTSDELDLALGRSNVIHAALLAGPASKTFLSRSQTLVRYRMADDGKTGVGGTAKHTARHLAIEPSTTEPPTAEPLVSAALSETRDSSE